MRANEADLGVEGTAVGELDPPLSVLHVVSYYPPDRVGGVGEHVRVIHEGHLAAGVESEVLTSGSTSSNPRVYRIGRTPLGFLMNSWRRIRLAKGRDVVHAHHGEGLLFLLLVRMQPRRPRILVMFHVDVRRREVANRSHVFEGKRYGAKGLTRVLRRVSGFIKIVVERAAWMLADAVVVETKAVQAELSDLRPRKATSVIPHGLGEATKREHDAVGPIDLLFVGTPGIRKRTHLLPSVLAGVRKRIPDARLRIVGFNLKDDPDLRLEAERLGVLSAIDFVGAVRSEEVVPFYRAAKVLVLPSAYEGLPMVLLEAMREGLVPVTTNVSGHPEAIADGVDGYLVPVDDVAAIADRCVRLMTNPKLRREISDQARLITSERFPLETELDAYMGLYRRLIAFDEFDARSAAA